MIPEESNIYRIAYLYHNQKLKKQSIKNINDSRGIKYL